MGYPILYCGDPHGRFDHILAAARAADYDAIVVVGDLDLTRPLHDELGEVADRLWYIPGNHDSDSDTAWANLCDGPLADRNLHGRVVVLPSGMRLAGLGGVFRGSVWNPATGTPPTYKNRAEHAKATPRKDRWRGEHPPRRHLSTIYPEDVDRLADMRADVLVTHEAPGYHPHGVVLLDTLARAIGVRVLVHGHHHDAIDSRAKWAAQGFRTYGVGLRGLTAIDADGQATTVLPGELDHTKRERGEVSQCSVRAPEEMGWAASGGVVVAQLPAQQVRQVAVGDGRWPGCAAKVQVVEQGVMATVKPTTSRLGQE